MKKLGTPESDPPKLEGKGGVSAEGETALPFFCASSLAPPLLAGLPDDPVED